MGDVDIKKLAEDYRVMQGIDYYEILKIEPVASKEKVRMAYFRESKIYHPDRYFRQISSEDLKIVNEIYKLIAEAYRVLSDSMKRRQYDRGLEMDRKKFLRYEPAKYEEALLAASAKKTWTEAIVANPMAKKYVKEAISLMRRKQYAQAEMQVKLAISMEKNNEDLDALAAEIAQLKNRSSKNTPRIQ